jgi:hypothetical protein
MEQIDNVVSQTASGARIAIWREKKYSTFTYTE